MEGWEEDLKLEALLQQCALQLEALIKQWAVQLEALVQRRAVKLEAPVQQRALAWHQRRLKRVFRDRGGWRVGVILATGICAYLGWIYVPVRYLTPGKLVDLWGSFCLGWDPAHGGRSCLSAFVRRASICQHLLWWRQLWCVPQGKKKLLSGVLRISVLQSTMLHGNCCKAFSIACIFSAAKHNAFSTMNYFLQWKFLSAVRCEWWLPNASCWEVLRGALIDCFPFVHCRISRHSCSAMFFLENFDHTFFSAALAQHCQVCFCWSNIEALTQHCFYQLVILILVIYMTDWSFQFQKLVSWGCIGSSHAFNTASIDLSQPWPCTSTQCTASLLQVLPSGA